jgi:hypothetical protein
VSAEDRALQRETTWKLYAMLERLTFVADSIVDARDQAKVRAEKLPKGDAVQKRLLAFADALEGQRTALVATKEAEGGISGEEKLREELGMLYGNVNGYEGRPTASQTSRMAVLGQDMEAAYARFVATADKEMAALNPQLKGKKLDPIAKLTQEEWARRRKR